MQVGYCINVLKYANEAFSNLAIDSPLPSNELSLSFSVYHQNAALLSPTTKNPKDALQPLHKLSKPQLHFSKTC